MKVVWTAAVGLVVFAMLGTAEGQDKKATGDKAKLIGVWEVVKSESNAPPGATLEFTKDGKILMTAKVDDMTISMKGTYTVDGNKVTVIIKQGGKEQKDTATIKTLTDTKLVTIDDKGKEDEFKRKK